MLIFYKTNDLLVCNRFLELFKNIVDCFMCQTDINSALAGVPEDTYNKGQNSYLNM